MSNDEAIARHLAKRWMLGETDCYFGWVGGKIRRFLMIYNALPPEANHLFISEMNRYYGLE